MQNSFVRSWKYLVFWPNICIKWAFFPFILWLTSTLTVFCQGRPFSPPKTSSASPPPTAPLARAESSSSLSSNASLSAANTPTVGTILFRSLLVGEPPPHLLSRHIFLSAPHCASPFLHLLPLTGAVHTFPSPFSSFETDLLSLSPLFPLSQSESSPPSSSSSIEMFSHNSLKERKTRSPPSFLSLSLGFFLYPLSSPSLLWSAEDDLFVAKLPTFEKRCETPAGKVQLYAGGTPPCFSWVTNPPGLAWRTDGRMNVFAADLLYE